jgi:nickel-dependent lactate racemase
LSVVRINVVGERVQQIDLAYGDGFITVALPSHARIDIHEPHPIEAQADGEREVRRAMAEPIGTRRLAELARGKRKIAIVIDDHTRPVPNVDMLRPILDELALAGIERDRVTVVVATGLHRDLAGSEMKQLTGDLPLRTVCHDARDPDKLVSIGTTGSGEELLINRCVVEADLRILTGDIELHQFVGYGGGAKSVMPGIADADSVRRTHSQMEAPGTAPGVISGNPVRAEVEAAADLLGVHFCVNVVLNDRHQIVGAFAGDVHQAFTAGTALVDRMYKVVVPQRYDAVLASPGGCPKDLELYQSQKAITNARRIVKRGGKVIICAECREGHGSAKAYEWVRSAQRPEDIVDRFRAEFVMGGHKAYQLALDALYARVCLYTSLSEEVVEAFFFECVKDLQQIALLLGDARSIAVLPQATLMLPMLSDEEVPHA